MTERINWGTPWPSDVTKGDHYSELTVQSKNSDEVLQQMTSSLCRWTIPRAIVAKLENGDVFRFERRGETQRYFINGAEVFE